MSTSFLVEAELVPLSIDVADEAVVRIRLGRSTDRPASTFHRQVAREIAEYFAGSRQEFTFPIRTSGTAFERSVWEELRAIPYGEIRTYGEVASALGSPGASRAVGLANHRNPIPIVIPCHRVVAAGGKLGGYGGGLKLKRRLLALEGANLPALWAPK